VDLKGGIIMEFKAAIDAYFNAVKGRNIEAFSPLVKEDGKTTLILPTGKLILGYRKIIDFHINWFEDLDWSMAHEVIHLWENGNAGGGLFKVTYGDVKESGEPYMIHYYLNLLFERVSDRWLLHHDQNTLIA